MRGLLYMFPVQMFLHCFIEANFESLEGNSGKRRLAAHDTASIVVVVFDVLYYS